MVHTTPDSSSNSTTNQNETLHRVLLNNPTARGARRSQSSRSLQTFVSNDESIQCKSLQHSHSSNLTLFNKIRSKSTSTLSQHPGVLLKYRPSSSSRKG